MKTNPRTQLLRILAEVGQYRTGLRKRWDVTVSAWGPDGKYGPRPHAELPEADAWRWTEAVQSIDDMIAILAQARELAERERAAHVDRTCEACRG